MVQGGPCPWFKQRLTTSGYEFQESKVASEKKSDHGLSPVVNGRERRETSVFTTFRCPISTSCSSPSTKYQVVSTSSSTSRSFSQRALGYNSGSLHRLGLSPICGSPARMVDVSPAGWWARATPLKNMTSSIGMIRNPILMGK